MRCLHLLVIMLLGLVAGGCDHIELVDELPANRVPVRVVFDWTDDPEARPEGMTLYIYRMGLTRATTPYIYDFEGREGGTILLSPGTYAAICHNSDSDRHGFVGRDSYDDFGLALNTVRGSGMGSAAYSVKAKESERLAHAPDSIWVGSVEAFAVPTREAYQAMQQSQERGASDNSAFTLSIPMQSVVQHYTFIIHHPINLTASASVAASVSGMPSTVHPGRGMTGEETVSHSFGMKKLSDGSLWGEVLTFGHCGAKPLGTRGISGLGTRAEEGPDDEILHLLKVQATHSGGQVTSSEHDVTGQIHSFGGAGPGERPPEIVVELDTVVIPPPSGGGGGGGGFSPTVGGWTGSSEELGM